MHSDHTTILPESLDLPAGPFTPAPGVRLGAWRLEALLGRGATATVWRAVDLRFHAQVALKLFDHAAYKRGDALGRVMNEARAASRVLSEHVVRVHDAGRVEVGDGEALSYIAMELCAGYQDGSSELQIGRPLDQVEPDSLHEALRWGLQVARGVADAHREGVFHRDLKPANVLLRPGSRRAQILDFGLAVPGPATPSGEGAAPSHTGTIWRPWAADARVAVSGTPGFLAPEQARGFPVHPDPVADRERMVRVDVWGVGVVLFHLLAGHAPYRAPAHSTDPVEDLLEAVRNGPPRPIGFVRTRFPVAPRLARIVDKAMAWHPGDRYASAQALADDLAAFLEGRPTSLDVGRPGLQAALWLWRNRLGTTTALMQVVLVGSAVWTFGLRQQAEEARAEEARAVVAADEANRQRELALADAAQAVAVARAAEATALEEAAEAGSRAQRAKSEAAAAKTRQRQAEAQATDAEQVATQARLAADAAAQAEADARRRAREATNAKDAADLAREMAEAERASALAAAAAADAARQAAEARARLAEAERAALSEELAAAQVALTRSESARRGALDELGSVKAQLDALTSPVGVSLPPVHEATPE